MKKIDLRNLTPRAMEALSVTELGQKPGQGLRLAALLLRDKIRDLDGLTVLNKAFRERIRELCYLSSVAVEKIETAQDCTSKLLYRLDDGHTVEGVLIPGNGRLTLCVSSQVGCASGCTFCLTGAGGFIRNLTTAELVNQLFSASDHTGGLPISNIVLMGTGEPLGNYDAVRAFIELATDRHGLALAPRKVTLSTCGIAPMIERMADDGVAASLAVSLHAPTDDIRSRLMRVNDAYPLSRLLQALRYYTERTGRHVTIEYVLFQGINDRNDDAKKLADLLRGLPCMINLMLFNPFPGCGYERPDEFRASVFRDILVSSGYVTVIRGSRGSDILAACGQLRAASRQ